MTIPMTRKRVLEIVREARERGETPDLRHADLHHADLCNANLSGADMYGADLCNANLSGADMYGANLRHANLHHANLHSADLRHADLHHANLHSADLRHADLRHADLTGLFLQNLPSGNLAFIPTPDGWHLRIGCWSGTTDDLRAMIHGDDDTAWPEARGDAITARRPMLDAAAAMCDAYAAAHPTAVDDLRRIHTNGDPK